MYNEKICQRLRANSVVSAWENQRLLRCEKWPRKEKTCRRTKCWNKATNDSNQLRRARMWTFRFPRLIEAVWTHPTSQMLFKSTISETGLYTLGTKAGTLNTRFSRNQFNLMNQKFLTTADVPEDVTLSVREAARLHSNTGGQGFFKCLCQTAVGVQIDWFPQSFHTTNIVICISIISMNNMMETSGPRHEEAWTDYW